MTKFALTVSAAALALAGAAAYAAPASAPATVMPAMPRADRTVTRAEAQTLAAARFDLMDVNHDGKLDPADRTAEQAAMFDRVDTDHNGSLSRAEFAALRGGPRGMAREGMNHDGDHAGMAHDGAASGRRGIMGAGMAGMAGMGGMARMADADGDHAVTRDEFSASALRRFDAIDANRDGSVTPAEQQAAMAAMRARMSAGRGVDAPMSPPPPPTPGE